MTENCIKSQTKPRKKRRDLALTTRAVRHYQWMNLLCKSGTRSAKHQQGEGGLSYSCLSARRSRCQTVGLNSTEMFLGLCIKGQEPDVGLQAGLEEAMTAKKRNWFSPCNSL